MVLKRIIFCSLCFAAKVFSNNPDFHDFHYMVDMTVKKDQSLIETLTDMISESQIIAEIKQLRTFSLQNRPVNNMRALKNRIINDIALMHKKAHFSGFYDTKISHKIIKISTENVVVRIRLDFGQKFNLKLNVRYANQDEKFNNHYASILQKDLRKLKASMKEIKSLIGIAINNLQKNGFFKPEILEKRVYIDHETHEAILNLVIDPGQRVFFSNVEIKSYPGISDEFVKNRIAWEKDEIFNTEKIELTAENLKNTQIFSKIKIKPDDKSITNGKIPIIIELQEEKKHTVDATILYSGIRNMNFEKKSRTQKSLKSIIARLAWTNCNTFGGGEKLRATVEGTPMKVREKRTDYAFEIALSSPDIFLKNNISIYSVSRRQILTNIFFKKSDHWSIMFNYQLLDSLLVRAGGQMEKNYVDADGIFYDNKDNKRKYDNFSIPVELIIDRTDDLLNPTSGYRATFKVSEMFFRNSTISRLKTFDMTFSYNYSLNELKYTVLAFNISRRSILGQKIDAIPIDKRIYAGGMDSVRGYANQMATEIIHGEETPMGGKSSLEFNSEVRRKISENFGCVVFFDGAKVFQNKSCYVDLQTEKKRWFYSVGIGIRYFTSIGPIRADFAFPIRRRKGIDSKMQFIMSLGQAF